MGIMLGFAEFPFLLGGTFIEAKSECEYGKDFALDISLPFGRDFH